MQISSLIHMPRPRILYPKCDTESSELMAEKGLMLSEMSEPMICTNGLTKQEVLNSSALCKCWRSLYDFYMIWWFIFYPMIRFLAQSWICMVYKEIK